MRGLDRSDDTAVRLALGASSGRLLREFLMESVLLAALGGVLGAAIAVAGLRLVPALDDGLASSRRGGAGLPRAPVHRGPHRALGDPVRAAAGLAADARGALGRTLRRLSQNNRRPPPPLPPRRHRRQPGGDGGGLDARARDSWFAASCTFAASIPASIPEACSSRPSSSTARRTTAASRTRTYYRTLFERLAAVPGVVAVGGATTVPTSPLGPDFERPVWPEGTAPDSSKRMPASVRMVTPGYFPALGLRIADGRAMDDRDQPTSPRVIMVNETLAKRLWPGQRAVGQQLVVDYSTAGTYPYEIVGVVGDMRFRGPRAEPQPEIYIPHAQRSYLIMNVVLKSAGDPRALIPTVRDVLKEIDPQKPAHGLYPLEDLIGATYARDRQAMVTLLVFAGTTIFLAVLSVYGVLSQRVRERSREIGIRMAMGANASSADRLGRQGRAAPDCDRAGGRTPGRLDAGGRARRAAVRRGADRCRHRRRRGRIACGRRAGGHADPVLASDADRSGGDPAARVMDSSCRFSIGAERCRISAMPSERGGRILRRPRCACGLEPQDAVPSFKR